MRTWTTRGSRVGSMLGASLDRFEASVMSLTMLIFSIVICSLIVGAIYLVLHDSKRFDNVTANEITEEFAKTDNECVINSIKARLRAGSTIAYYQLWYYQKDCRGLREQTNAVNQATK